MCSVPWLFLIGCQYQCKWLTGKTRFQNDLQCVDGDVKPYSLTHSFAYVSCCRSSIPRPTAYQLWHVRRCWWTSWTHLQCHGTTSGHYWVDKTWWCSAANRTGKETGDSDFFLIVSLIHGHRLFTTPVVYFSCCETKIPLPPYFLNNLVKPDSILIIF